MKSQMIRISLLLSWGLLLMLGLLSWGVKEPDPVAAYAPPHAGEAAPNASFHFWQINEIFSCPDGSAQFVEMVTGSTGQQFLENQVLRATSGAQTHSFIFPNNSPDYNTTPKSLLIATAGFGSLPGGITPDFILPANFIFTVGSGSVELVGAATLLISYSSGGLPLDGITSLGQGGATGVNSPRNFAGQTSSISCPAVPNLTLTKTADAPGTGIVEAGGVLSYTITVFNSGNAAATSALITDAVPISTTYVPNSASNGGSFSSGIISWPNLTINPATSLTRAFQVTVSGTVTTGNKITNTAYITSAQGVSATGFSVVTVGDVASGKTYLPLILKNS